MTHPGTDVLAEFRAGLITGHRGDRIAVHLAGCERCSATDAQLAGLPAMLAAALPPAMPAEVAGRLDQVLAAEAANRDRTERAGSTEPPPASTPPPRERHRFRMPSLRVLTPVAAATVILGAGVYGLSQLGGGSPVGPDSSAAASSAARSVAAGNAPKAQARAPEQGAAAPGTGPSPASPEEQPVSFVYLTSRTNFVPATLVSQLENELARTPAAAGTVLLTPDAVRGCVARVARGASVTRVEAARYQGQDATVIFTRDGQGYRVLITGPGCSGTSGQVVATRNLPAGISGP